MTDCERTALYLDGELPAREEEAALQHLAGCSRCQAELGDWVGLETALSRSRGGHAPAAARPRHRPWWIGGLAIAAAAAAIALIWLWPGKPRGVGDPDAPAIALAEARSLEARLTAPAFDRYRPYRVERGNAARELLPLDVLSGIERRGDRAALAAAHALGGDLTRAAAALEASPASASRDSDLAAVALIAGEPVRALELADRAIAAAPELAPARWNRALALRALDLPLVAAAELDRVAARGEPGWSDEARSRAAALRAPLAARAGDLAAYEAAASAMIAGSGPPLDRDMVRRHPGLARRALLDALAAAGSAGEARALAPLAAELDRLAGHDLAARAVAAVAARDFAVRRRFQASYRALVAGKLDDARRDALIEELERAGDAVTDVLAGVLLRAPTSDANLARLRRAILAGNPWLGRYLVRREAAARASAGDLFGAEHTLLAAAPACRDPAFATICGHIELELGDLYLRMRRLDEAEARLRAARALFATAGAPEHEDRTLASAVNLERLRDRDGLAVAYLEEYELRAPGSCNILRFADSQRTMIAFDAGDLATARARLPEAGRCGAPPSEAVILHAAAIARVGDDGDRARAAALIDAARKAGRPAPAVAAELAEGRLRIDADPAGGAAGIRAGLAAIAKLGGTPGTAGELRAWGFAALIGDAGRRGDWTGALALFAEELGRGVPAGCVVGVSSDAERSTAVVRGRDGVLRGSYQPDRALGVLGADTIVPPGLAATLDGCDAISVIARPPLHGRAELLPPSLPWAFVGTTGDASPPATPSKRRVIVTDARPPAALGLPSLPPVAVPGAVAVTAAAATPSRVRAELRDAGYIELHAHGVLDAATSEAAFLALSPDPDGRFALTAAEVGATRLTGAPIVVLAACHAAKTARYEARRWSLPDAFLAAGARAVVASTTAIPDDQGATLFAELRARLDRGESVARAVAALRAGRLAAGQPWAAGLMVLE